jgi:hypothetical protein
MIESEIASQGFTSDSDRKIMKVAIQRFVEEKAKSLGLEELADALDSPEQILKLFLDYICNK